MVVYTLKACWNERREYQDAEGPMEQSGTRSETSSRSQPQSVSDSENDRGLAYR